MNNYYRVLAEIDLDIIVENIKQIKSHLQEEVSLMAVIKADGYGHGASAIAKTLVDNGVDSLGVAVIEEGIALRKKGIENPILILGFTAEYQYGSLIQYSLSQTVFKYTMAEAISKVAVQLKKTAKIHIKIDTGMGRIGFSPNAIGIEEIKKIVTLPNLDIEGIFTHFSSADVKDKTYSIKQIRQFNEFIRQLKEAKIKIPMCHMSNSAGIIDMDEAQYNAVRAGLLIYGLYPSQEVQKERIKLKPALQLKSHIIFLKEVEAGSCISYNATYVTKRKSLIATIPVGYGDGYPRALSSTGRVLVRGVYAPIVGRVCMDQFMIDVTHIAGVEDGDEVILIGNQGDNCVSAEELAERTGTINYEIICGLGKRIPRVYRKQNKIVNTVDYFDVL